MTKIMLRHLRTLGWGRTLVVILVIWFIVMLSAILPLISNHNNNEPEIDQKMSHRLSQALYSLETLKKQNEELRKLLSEISYSNFNGDQKELFETIRNRIQRTERLIKNQQDFGFISSKEEPNSQYEKLRRRLTNNVQELAYFLSAELNNILKMSDESTLFTVKDTLRYIRDLSLEHKKSLLKDLTSVAMVDGYEAWREKEAEKLSDLVQRRLEYLQNPLDCNKTRKLVCSLNKGCGYGCQLHHLTFCLTVAYGSQRTLVLNSKGWRYHKAGWEEVFLPVGSCTTKNVGVVTTWPGESDTISLHLPIIDNLSPPPPFVPPAIPEDLAPRLVRLHGDPIVWWIGQMLKYLLRPQPSTAKMIAQATKNINFQKPIVGIHVRRTDKIGTEAAFHPLKEYMAAVEAYYEQLEMTEKVDQRRVYIATDDPKVIADARTNYPNYEVLGDPHIAKTAAVSTRYSEQSLYGIVLDIHFLSMSDYLVCTFSSQVCRTAYEIMQNYYPDASARFRSLDDIYYFGGGGRHIKIAHLNHKPVRADEIELEAGDEIHIAGNHWNGFSKGKNLRRHQIGLFPSFKVEDKIVTAKFATYPEVPLTIPASREVKNKLDNV